MGSGCHGDEGAGHVHGHGHGPAHGHGHAHHGVAGTRRRLAGVLVLTAAVMVAELVGGLLTGSLALLADAGHMLSDVASLGLALGAIWLATRPATPERSFGFRRAEILAALTNGVALVAIAIWIFIEGAARLGDPPDVPGGPLLAVALVGLVVNLGAVALLRGGRRASLNVSAAFRHVVADLLGSAGVLVAAVVILLTGWRHADPIVAMVIGVLVLASSWTILRDSVRILLEAAPRGLDVDDVGRRMARSPGVVEVHDLHVWQITEGFPALAAHVLVGPEEDCHARRREIELMLGDVYGIAHTTLQVDHRPARQSMPGRSAVATPWRRASSSARP